MLRRVLYILLLLVASLVFYKSDLLIYGIRQLHGQLRIINLAIPVEKVLADPLTPDSIRQKLLFIEEVRRFAIDSLNLKNSKNYTTFYNQQGKPAIWVITACEPFEMKAYEWHFPFLGAVSYKGFFKKERGLTEVDALRKAGFDVEYAPAGGWSTLGFFRDPVLSGMLRRNKGQLAELIIHELTHATIYLKNRVEFNENLATFIGEKGAEQFLISRYGSASVEVQQYRFELEDEQRFGNYMVDGCNELKTFYGKMDSTLPIREKYLLKYRKIASIIVGIDSLALHYPERYRYNLPEDKLPDNTFFMGYQRYRGNLKELEDLYTANGQSIDRMLRKLKEKD